MSCESAPHRQNRDDSPVIHVIDMVSGSTQQHATNTWYTDSSVPMSDLRSAPQYLERLPELIPKEPRCSRAVLPPPRVDATNVIICFRCRDEGCGHERRRSSSRISDAGRVLPWLAVSQEAAMCSCSATRSWSLRSSPSSSATNCNTVPSGSEVASFKTRRPFTTIARSTMI